MKPEDIRKLRILCDRLYEDDSVVHKLNWIGEDNNTEFDLINKRIKKAAKSIDKLYQVLEFTLYKIDKEKK